MKILNSLLLFAALCISIHSSAQKFSKVKYNDVSVADFDNNSYSIDTSANAVVLLDLGTTNFIGKGGWFNYVYKGFMRIKILRKAGMEAANQEISFYNNGNESEEVSDIKATTYNYENGKIISTNLNPSDIYDEQLNKHYTLKKFALPAVKEGSIIEISYTKTSSYLFELPTWDFQSENYPKVFCDYQIAIPSTLGYIIKRTGIDSFSLSKTWNNWESFMMDGANVSTEVKYYQWEMKNVPALKIQNYVSSPLNYEDKLEFQLASTYNGETVHDMAGDWNKTADFLLHLSDFGVPLKEDVVFNELDNSIDQSMDKLTIAKNIYVYIQNEFTCTNHNFFLASSTLQNVVKNKKGNVGEINLLLINKLRKFGINADPVIISTRENGFGFSKYPMLTKFNYLVCQVGINGKIYYLDASDKLLGFGKIRSACYNGSAVEITQDPQVIDLSADSLQETQQTTVLLFNGDKGLEGNVSENYGDIESYNTREKLEKTNQNDFLDAIKNSYTSPVTAKNLSVENVDDHEKNITVKYDLSIDAGNDDIIYFTPVLSSDIKENPFTAEQRFYPVEMPYCMDKTYILNMEIPKGYTVAEMPKSTRVNLNGDDGIFEYLIANTGTNVQLKCRIKLNRANFETEDYNNLRDFFAYVVKKEAEQIVFKKQ